MRSIRSTRLSTWHPGCSRRARSSSRMQPTGPAPPGRPCTDCSPCRSIGTLANKATTAVIEPVLCCARPARSMRRSGYLQRAALPHLQQVVAHVRETVSRMVRVDASIQFVASVESDQVLRVCDRAGLVLPAHLTSGGKALLATVPPDDLAELCPDTDPRRTGPAEAPPRTRTGAQTRIRDQLPAHRDRPHRSRRDDPGPGQPAGRNAADRHGHSPVRPRPATHLGARTGRGGQRDGS